MSLHLQQLLLPALDCHAKLRNFNQRVHGVVFLVHLGGSGNLLRPAYIADSLQQRNHSLLHELEMALAFDLSNDAHEHHSMRPSSFININSDRNLIGDALAAAEDD